MKIGIVSQERAGPMAAMVATSADAEVAWSVDSVAAAADRTRHVRADVVLIDVAMLAGGAARELRSIGAPVVVLRSPGVDDGAVYEAMSEGASYALDLPTSDATRRDAMRKVRRACGTPTPARSIAAGGDPILVAIGSSTGGPAALRTVLAGVVRLDRCAILIVQHLEPEYVPGLATWLGHEVGLEVALSTHGESLAGGRAVIASSGDHLVLARSGVLEHRKPRPGEIHHPSIDVLFESLAATGRRGVAALLTGMGRDGAAGLLALRRAGWSTVAQDEATSSVYGMPRAAKDLDAADAILPVEKIGAWIARAVSRTA